MTQPITHAQPQRTKVAVMSANNRVPVDGLIGSDVLTFYRKVAGLDIAMLLVRLCGDSH
jgi:hypothetical protein